MKKFTQIREEFENKNYYQAKAEVTLQVEAENEGEAGYLFDSILGSIGEQVDHSIINIEKVDQTEFDAKLERYRAISTEREQDVDTSTLDDYIRTYMSKKTVTQLFNELKEKGYEPSDIGNRLAIFFDKREF